MLEGIIIVTAGVLLAVICIQYSSVILGFVWWTCKTVFVVMLFGLLGVLTQFIGP